MNRWPSFAIVAALATALVPAITRAGADRSPALHTTPCTRGKAHVAAICGTFRVSENRETQTGRTIELHFIVLKARHPATEAVYMNPGGPGAAELSFADFIADGQGLNELDIARRSIDVLLVDNRGMGASHDLDCDLQPVDRPELSFSHLWPATLVDRCRAKLAASSDLNAYTTENAADDLDDLRAALGYGKLDFDGGSYGTYLSLTYAHRHPEHVHRIVLQGVVSPHITEVFLGFAHAEDAALARVIRACANDAYCSAHHPHFAANLAALEARFERGDVRVPLNGTTYPLSREVFADTLRHILYANESAARVPALVDAAAAGNLVPLGREMRDEISDFGSGIATGAFLSYACAEYTPAVDDAAVPAATAGTFMGDSRVRAQQRACAQWHVNRIADANDAPRIDTPVLAISGTNDPATPPRYSLEQLQRLSHATRVVIEGATHGTETVCGDHLMGTFLLTGVVPRGTCRATAEPIDFARADRQS